MVNLRNRVTISRSVLANQKHQVVVGCKIF
jgi:hypothetical protein